MIDEKLLNWQTIGHERIKAYLQKSLTSKRLSHAYLFVGPEGSGKSTLAREFIGALICDNYSRDTVADSLTLGCNECDSCHKFAHGIYPDFIVIDPVKKLADDKESGKPVITIDDVRELKHRAGSTAINNYRVVLINGAQYLTIAAANALLKTLEEPGERTVFILFANDTEEMPTTIVSRCQVIKFLPVSTEIIYEDLVKRGVDRFLARQVAKASFGRPKLASQLAELGTTNSNEPKKLFNEVETFLEFFNKSITERLQLVEKLAGKEVNREVLHNFFKQSVTVSRDVMLWQLLSQESYIVNENFLEQIKKLAQVKATKYWVELSKKLERYSLLLNTNVNLRLLWEELVVNL